MELALPSGFGDLTFGRDLNERRIGDMIPLPVLDKSRLSRLFSFEVEAAECIVVPFASGASPPFHEIVLFVEVEFRF